MRESAISPDNLVPALLAHRRQRGFALGWHGAADPLAWRAQAMPVLRALALPDLPEALVTLRLLRTEDRGTHQAQELELDFGSGMIAGALMLVPKGQGPFPAVLVLHDHGSEFRIGKEKCIPPPGPDDPVAVGWAERFFGGQPIGTGLVSRGFAVLCVDALGWGGRMGNGYGAQQALAANLLQIGLSPASVMAWEDCRAMAFLAGHPAIDAARIAAVGFSLGGFRAWQLAALSSQVAATVSIGWMASLPGLMCAGNNQTRGQSAFWMAHPLLYRHLDLPDIAALSAPRPMWVEVAADDPLFPAAAVDAAFATLGAVWRAHGAADQLVLRRPEGGHRFAPDRQAAVFDWLAGHLA
ncbi:dienelactone hydrolase family protein [Pseudotabrizicola sp. 4114]|uniref:dienelactone hydrolase family protein n=1 Tax=Pseudotabrizicola sp. 4114 TaxID=2817731 RepID=UPI00285EF1E5|nr:dienelactone hydrolase [Pseudorhodobacter sp. 4114]